MVLTTDETQIKIVSTNGTGSYAPSLPATLDHFERFADFFDLRFNCFRLCDIGIVGENDVDSFLGHSQRHIFSKTTATAGHQSDFCFHTF